VQHCAKHKAIGLQWFNHRRLCYELTAINTVRGDGKACRGSKGRSSILQEESTQHASVAAHMCSDVIPCKQGSRFVLQVKRLVPLMSWQLLWYVTMSAYRLN